MSSNERRARLRAQGLCVQCAQPTELRTDGRPRGTCLACQAKCKTYHVTWAARLKAVGGLIGLTGETYTHQEERKKKQRLVHQIPTGLRMVMGSNQLTPVPIEVRRMARVLFQVRRDMFHLLETPRRTLARGVLMLLADVENRAIS